MLPFTGIVSYRWPRLPGVGFRSFSSETTRSTCPGPRGYPREPSPPIPYGYLNGVGVRGDRRRPGSPGELTESKGHRCLLPRYREGSWRLLSRLGSAY